MLAFPSPLLFLEGLKELLTIQEYVLGFIFQIAYWDPLLGCRF